MITAEEKRARDRKYGKRWRDNNPDKTAAKLKRWSAANPDKIADYNKRQRYGMPQAFFDEMAKDQNGLCAICGRADKKLVVDHCHTSGNVRALLCNACNTALGKFRDDPSLLHKAARYLVHFGVDA